MSTNEPDVSRSNQSLSDEKEKNKSKPATLYIGIIFNFLATGFVVGGLCSDRWVVLSEGHGAVPNNIRTRLASHFGPWKACRHDRSCGDPWDIVAGIGREDFKWIQLLFGTALALHLVGLIVLCFKCWHLFFYQTHWFIDKFNKYVCAEFIICLATILTITSMLAMGQVKRMVIIRHHQLEHTGSSLILTLVSVLLVFCGILLMAFSSVASSHLWINYHSHQFLRRLCNLKTLRDETNPSEGDDTNGNNITSQVSVACISPPSNGVNQSIVVVDKVSDAQRPEDDFILKNTRSLVGAKGNPESAHSPRLQIDHSYDGATGGCCETDDDASSQVRESVHVVKEDKRCDCPEADVMPRNTDCRRPVGFKQKLPDKKNLKRTHSGDTTSNTNSSILQTAKRFAAETFARPFQTSDRNGDDFDNSSYPGDGGIAVLKFVDV